MAFTQDPRFDAAFIDNVDNTEPTVTDLSALTVDWLPIMLTRNAGQIGFSRTYASPAAGGLGEGNQIDSTPGSWITLSQTDWVNGLLEDTAYAATTKFNDAVADTRYTGILTLPPKVYGPYPTGGTVGNHVRLRWIQYYNYLYIVQDSKLYRSKLDENGVSGTSVIANWSNISSNAIFASATDLSLYEYTTGSGSSTLYYFRLYAVDGTIAGRIFDENGNVLTKQWSSGQYYAYMHTGYYPKYVACTAINNGYLLRPSYAPPYSVFKIDANPFGFENGVSSIYFVVSDARVYVNNAWTIGGSTYIVCNDGIYAYSATHMMTKVVTFNQYAEQSTGRVSCMFKGAAYFGSADDIIKFDGTTLTNVGLNRLAKVPSTVSMKARMMVATDDTLYVLTGETGKIPYRS